MNAVHKKKSPDSGKSCEDGGIHPSCDSAWEKLEWSGNNSGKQLFKQKSSRYKEMKSSENWWGSTPGRGNCKHNSLRQEQSFCDYLKTCYISGKCYMFGVL